MGYGALAAHFGWLGGSVGYGGGGATHARWRFLLWVRWVTRDGDRVPVHLRPCLNGGGYLGGVSGVLRVTDYSPEVVIGAGARAGEFRVVVGGWEGVSWVWGRWGHSPMLVVPGCRCARGRVSSGGG